MSKPWKVIAVTWSEEGNACLEIEGLTRVGITEARLIAASPDLLADHEMNLADLVFLNQAITSKDPSEELLVRVSDLIKRTEKVIAKAEGK